MEKRVEIGVAVRKFEKSLDLIDDYVMLRSQGTIDPQLLDKAERKLQKLRDDKNLRIIGRRSLFILKKIEECLDAGKKYKKAIRLAQRMPRENTEDILRAIIEYELNHGPVPPFVEEASPSMEETPIAKEVGTGSVISLHIAETEPEQWRILRAKAGTMDISGVIERLAKIATELNWFITTGDGVRTSKAELQIVALCLRAGEGETVSPAVMENLGIKTRTITESLQSFRFLFRESPLEIVGNATKGIVLQSKERTATESA